MKQIITKFDDETGDFEIAMPVPFTLKDGIEYVDMMVADIPKYEDTKDYNVFDLIRENQELRKQTEEHNLAIENLAYWKGKNESKMKINRLRKENKELKKQLSNSHQIKAQQKEFIEWLEQKTKNYELPLTDENKKALGYTLPMKGIYKEILEKYKEIVGDKNEIQDE